MTRTEALRSAAHLAMRDAIDLLQALNCAAEYPGVITDSDREVLIYRAKCLNNNLAPLLRMQPMTVGGRTNPNGAA